MTVTVLTLVQDRPAHLTQLVEGLRRSAVMPDEFIVADMGSEPPITLGETPFPIRNLRLARDGLPLAAARNAAARASRGDVLLFLDVDCIPMRGLVGAMADVIGKRDALVCPQVRYLGPGDARADWQESDLLEHSSNHPGRRFPASGLRHVRDAGLFWSLVFGLRRLSFQGLGGFDEGFTGYGAEDTDFGFRARQAGLPLLFTGASGAFHQFHDTFEPPLQHFEDIVRNARLFREKWNQWPMSGWLSAFQRAGLIEWTDDRIEVLRKPNITEIAAARVVTALR